THYGVESMQHFFERTGISRMGLFNTGLFYFDRSIAASRLFDTARALASRSGDFGLRAFKNAPFADEPVFAAALELTGLAPLPWDGGRSMCTATADVIEGLDDIDVHTGRRKLIRYQTLTQPIILHF